MYLRVFLIGGEEAVLPKTDKEKNNLTKKKIWKIPLSRQDRF